MARSRRVRRVVAVLVLAALAVGVGLFVGVWLLGDGGGDDVGSPVAGSPAALSSG